jgi:hypothetical protein
MEVMPCSPMRPSRLASGTVNARRPRMRLFWSKDSLRSASWTIAPSIPSVIGCALLSCFAPDETPGSPPKNGHVTSSELGPGDDDDSTTADAPLTQAPTTPPTKTGSTTRPKKDPTSAAARTKACHDACLGGSSASVIQRAYEDCVTGCGRDTSCASDCDAAKAQDCAQTDACDDLDRCLASCS